MSSISGSTVYHILILSGLIILLGAALARRGTESGRGVRAGSPSPGDRWSIAAGMLVALQGLRLISAAWASTLVFQPLLDRLFSVLLPALAGWAALGSPPGGVPDRVVTGLVLGSAGLFAVSVFLGEVPLTSFNTSSLDLVWSLLALAAGAAALAAMVVRRPPQWAVFAGALAILVGGTLAHIATPPVTAASAPYVLLAEALAIPLVTVGAIWTFVREPWPVLPESAVETPFPAWRGLRAFADMEGADSGNTYADALVRAVGALLQAEYCLLLIPSSGDDALSIGAGFDALHDAPVRNVKLEPGGCPVVTQAMAFGRSVHLPGNTHSPDVRTILRGLGLSGQAPGLMVPLIGGGRTVAALTLISPRSQRAWDDATRLALEQLAPHFGARWLARIAGRAVAPTADSADLERARQQIAELEAKVARRGIPASELVGVEDVRNELDGAREEIDLLQAEIDRLRATAPSSGQPPEESARLQAELALALQALAESRSAAATPEPAHRPAAPSRRDPASSIHGVRQPLTAIAGYTGLLLGESIGLLGATQRRFLERIRTAVRRMDEELSALAVGLEAARAPSGPTWNELATLIEESLEVLHEDLRAKELSVRLDLPPAPVLVPGDPGSIRTIVSRLLLNASDVTPAGREVLVSVLPAADGLALMTVTDLGRGVAPADIGRVFTADMWDDPIPGLGRDASALAMVKNLSEEMGGRVWVESRPGSGTTFSVLLPTAR